MSNAGVVATVSIAMLLPFVFIKSICIYVCYMMTNKNQMSKKWCLLGLFDVPGVFILVFVTVVINGKRLRSNFQGGDMDYQYNYENNEEYHGGETHWHNIRDEKGRKNDTDFDNIANWQPAQNCKKKEDVMYMNGERVEREYVICKSCGGKMQKGTNFCTYCGRNL